MPDHPRKKLAVIGIGNVLYGDDGLGPRAIWALQSATCGTPLLSPLPPGKSLPAAGGGQGEGECHGHSLPYPPPTAVRSLPAVGGGQGRGSLSSHASAVDLIDGGSIGLDLLDYLKDYERVIIIDAADMGLAPGTVRTFTPDEVESLKSGKSLSLHSTDVLGVIALGHTLGETLAQITIIAVQPEFVGPRDGLSGSVEQSLPAVVEKAVSLIAAL